MPQWTKQSICRSDSKSAIGRVRYLEPAIARVDARIRRYFETQPEGETITVEVLKDLGLRRLTKLGGDRKLETVKQDVGRLVPIRMNAIFGADRVLTYRDGQNAPATRVAPTGEPEWIGKFTPHRVQAAERDRIVLDASTVRRFMCGDAGDVLDLAELSAAKGGRPVSLADPAWAELIKALLKTDEGIDLRTWRERIDELDAILDPELPIAPGGWEAAAFAGIRPSPGFDPSRMAAYYRACWAFTRGIRKAADFGRVEEFEYPTGEKFALGPIDPVRVAQAFDERLAQWTAFFESVSRSNANRDQNVDVIAADIRARLGVALQVHQLDRLDLVVRSLAVRASRHLNGKGRRDPLLNDAIDYDILFATMLPGVICTNDDGMLSLVKDAGSAQSWRVMSPTVLLAHLRGG